MLKLEDAALAAKVEEVLHPLVLDKVVVERMVVVMEEQVELGLRLGLEGRGEWGGGGQHQLRACMTRL